jgi:hypothetical protein
MATGSQRAGEDQRCFRQFLEWLDGGIDSDGQRYLEMHPAWWLISTARPVVRRPTWRIKF